MGLFSRPENLNDLTPPEMKFKMLTPPEHPCYAGQMIAYRIRIAPLVWMGWLTEITACQPYTTDSDQAYFIDEQRRGPYKLWHHRHLFERLPDGAGVRLTDTVTYQMHAGPLGRLAHACWVRRQLEGIFSYRKQALEEIIGN